MKKVELLSPVGNMECLYQAVHNGADAVYLGGKKFGARSYAQNFSEEEIIKAIEYCHLYGVKIYVTVNTMIYQNEMDEVLEYIRFLHLHGVDAIIVQDIGLMATLHMVYPNLEVHASTQAHNCNNFQLEILESMGVKRAVLARELSLEEIKQLTCPIEKEVFVHGALCVSYSGNCLFSSMNGGRSGNRGECTGCCRLPYTLECDGKEIKTDGEYLLSTKSLYTLDKIKDLIEAGITSFKIEGRMKSKEYVGYVTRAYRRAIDAYYNQEKIDIAPYRWNLQKLYSREFTNGYLFHQTGNAIMNIKSSNHIGIPIGTIIGITKDKIKIKLTEDLNQEDGIRFENGSGMIVNFLYNDKGLLTSKVSKGNIAIIDNKVEGKIEGIVRKTTDKLLLEEINQIEEKHIEVTMKCTIKKDEKIKLEISDGKHQFFIRGNQVEQATNSPTTKERIEVQLSKLGNTPFQLKSLQIEMDDDIFIPIKDLNEIRRNATEKLKRIRELEKKTFKESIEYRTSKYYIYPKFELNVAVRTEEQLQSCLQNHIASIYVSDAKLYEKYQDCDEVFYRTPRIVSEYPMIKGKKILATEIGACKKYVRENYVVSDYFLNVANNKTLSYLYQMGVKKVTLSVELSDDLLETINYRCCPVELLIYGRVELMVMKYCPLNMLIAKGSKQCNLCDSKKKYVLKNRQNAKFPIVTKKPYTYILQSENTNRIEQLSKYKSLGIKCYRIELFDESKEETDQLLKKVKQLVEEA